MLKDSDIKFMKRCLELARKADGYTYPNPLVGSVIVNDGKIIGEGFHLRAGGSHAEANAINSVKDPGRLAGSVLYVNLEPCSHFGKTPPCADLIISKAISKVVIGTVDTSAKVSGKGIAKLKAAGIEVVTGVLEDDCRYLNRRFFAFNEMQRPYITLKWAQSRDGFIDSEKGSECMQGPVWISGEAERSLVHKWRAEEQAILAGAGTIRADDPRLNVRDWSGNDPVKTVLTSSGKIPSTAAVLKSDGIKIVYTHNREASFPNSEKVMLDPDISSASQIVKSLYDRGIQSLFIEGGATVLRHFISEGLWDEARIFKGSQVFCSGTRAPLIGGSVFRIMVFEGSRLELIVNRQGLASVPVEY
jgi:diaminohydroxyphosphoribosylaminopyrimidine deaminase/5-amino-6-(5-phosphoribosylamino)uracil reductase